MSGGVVIEMWSYTCRQSLLLINPFAYEEYRKERIRQKIEEERASRIKVQVSVEY